MRSHAANRLRKLSQRAAEAREEQITLLGAAVISGAWRDPGATDVIEWLCEHGTTREQAQQLAFLTAIELGKWAGR